MDDQQEPPAERDAPESKSNVDLLRMAEEVSERTRQLTEQLADLVREIKRKQAE